jgi:hypothetical protein
MENQNIDREKYNRLLEIWQAASELNVKQLGNRFLMPLVPLEITKGSLLFIGLNPSFNTEYVKKALSDIEDDVKAYFDWSNEDVEAYFDWSNKDNFKPELDAQLTYVAKAKYPYFRKFREIAHVLGYKWDHCDLFFFRETSQRRFFPKILKRRTTLNEFGRKQLSIAFEMIDKAKPTSIIIANAFASDLYLRERKQRISFNPEKGCYYESHGSKQIPVFFSSMLTGQRALDSHSYRRLVWHIGHVFGEKIDVTSLPKSK